MQHSTYSLLFGLRLGHVDRFCNNSCLKLSLDLSLCNIDWLRNDSSLNLGLLLGRCNGKILSFRLGDYFGLSFLDLRTSASLLWDTVRPVGVRYQCAARWQLTVL